ncbi:MAG: hypothetical protein DI536_15345 [Archangium gephyra]|uniref:Uncharacterized protein n=1 Tax=Archangium gephyra TaxID=48 RepID=A0A2W5USU5_9BACT|nr:MAG: hypothetical protein DI536_15345 [Archangium gephyra]
MPGEHEPVPTSMQPLHETQEPPVHVWPPVHCAHALPPVPQRAGVVLVMQTPFSVQQPWGQSVALHV